MMHWRRFFRRRRREAEIAYDIEFYLDTETEENAARGMPPEEARAAARRKFGNPALISEEIHCMASIGFLETFIGDLGYGLRTMRSNPVFAVTAVLTLGLGIGANTAIFSVVHAVLLKPLEYPEPDRLVSITGGATVAKFRAIGPARSFTGVGAFTVFTENVALSRADGPESLKGARVSANFLRILGVRPLLGRGFLAEEETPGQQVAIISADLWHRWFGGDPRIVGGTATLGGAPCRIIGVLPPGFQFPFSDLDVWRPWQPDTMPLQSRLNSPILSVFGRLKPGVSLEQAGAELAVIHHQYVLTHPGKLDAKPNAASRPMPLKDDLVKNVRSILWMLFGAVGFVLIIACGNVASLLLARAVSRSQEFAVRTALGASRGRLIGQLVSESLLLAIAGGTLGLLLAKWSLPAIVRMPGLELPRVGEIHLDGTVLAFVLVLSVATGLFFGLAPAFSASRPDLAGVMKGSGETAPAGSPKRLMLWRSPRGLLVIGQVALSIVLVIGAALLIKSVALLRRVDLGFQPSNLLTMRVALPKGYDTIPKSSAFFEELVRRAESVPGVRSAAVTLTLPMTGFAGTPVHIMGRPPLKLNERPIAILQVITPAYFRTLEIPVRRGRDFAAYDTAGTTPVAIISESLARQFWPGYPTGEDPVGHYILAGANPEPLQIVGIVADIRQASLANEMRPGVYRPRSQSPPMSAMFAVRTNGKPMQFVNAVRREVMAIDRDQAINAVKTMDDIVDASEGQRRSITIVLGLFAGVGLLLAVVGIYGVVAYSVVQRTKEMGIRCALGAQYGNILRLVMLEGLGLTLVGAALGVGGALALTQVLKGLLYGVSATDPAVFAGITFLLIVVALAASYIPASRATRIDPMAALRMG